MKKDEKNSSSNSKGKIKQKIIRKVIIDTPTREDQFHGKGHERTAISLADAIREFDGEDRAIGLDGPWGSGKSSVVEIAANYLEKTRRAKEVKHHFFTFDIWKSQGAGFRRSFLEHFVSWAKDEFPKKRDSLIPIQKYIRGRTQEIETNNHPILGWFGIIILLILPFMPIYYFWAKSIFDKVDEKGNATNFVGSNPFWVITVFTAMVVLAAMWKWCTSDGGMGFKSALSSIILISSKQHQDHKVIQKIREIDPNDYEFHQTLRDILGVVQSPAGKVVMVLDNIDRLPQKEIREYWALVRSIFSRANQTEEIDPQKTITAIVPYDRALIEVNVSGESQGVEEGGKDGGENLKSSPLTRLSSREIFSKTFDEILNIAPPVLSNAREFFTEKLKFALPDQVSKDDGFRTYRIFCELLRKEGGITTPRQVVSFINDLSGLFVLHKGEFQLPTVATYLAHHDLITADPNVLNDLKNLDDKIVELASDPELQRHLAAMVFNVDADLAFQVLLDDEIARAALADSAEELIALSKSSGFDLRVDDVVRSNLDEWRSTAGYRNAIRNFAEMLPTFEGDAKPHVISALVEGLDGVERFVIEPEFYGAYLRLFEIADESGRLPLLHSYLRAGFAGVMSIEKPSYDDGEKFAAFLSHAKDKLQQLDLNQALRKELGNYTPNSSAEFLFGLAVNINESGFGFHDFGSVVLRQEEDANFFTEIAIDYPNLAVIAFPHFKQAKLVNNENWLAVADACLLALQSEVDEHDRVASLLEVVCYSWRSLPLKERGTVALEAAFSDGQFFRNLGLSETESSERSIANAFFLVGQIGLGTALATPTKKLQPNGQRPTDVSDEFNEFNNLVLGTKPLSDTQAGIIAANAKQALQVTNTWMAFGKANRDHKGVEQVVRQAFTQEDLPGLNLTHLLSYFDYLDDLLGSSKLIDVLTTIGQRIDESQISTVKLADVPQGFLTASHHAEGKNWDQLHDQVNAIFRAIEDADWTSHLETMDHETLLLIEKVSTTGCTLESARFREPLMKLILGVFSEEISPEADEGAIDTLMAALPPSYRDDICRTIREDIKGVTSSSLQVAVHLFPKLLSDIVQRGDRIKASEKDNVIRHILCSALEGRNRAALNIFVDMGRQRISDFEKSSDESTKKLLQGAMKSFSDSGEPSDWIRKVSETVLGKRRTKSLWDIWFGTADDAD